MNLYNYNKNIKLKLLQVLDFGLMEKILLQHTDFYFLRRFLDKDYINTAICYTGLAHLSHLSFILVNKFNFKVTHLSGKVNEYDIDKINQSINELSEYNPEKMYKIIDFTNPDFLQCSNMFNFPENYD